MTKREFIMQYVLNRASAVPTNLDGPEVVQTAAMAWDELQKVAPDPKTTFPPTTKSWQENYRDLQRL